ncbi:YggT family protein [Aurantiacibacter sp. MUD11]|nr:YggT family protein [Aurantiacibacter sp. MUD11]WAT19330.1 YggT family protein [Aurantiacibacter sp. MUD11]
MIAQAIVFLVIIQFIIGLLFSFNVISGRNEFLMQVFQSINSLLDPLLRPIRRLMPDTGAIDFSPLVLILALNAVIYILADVAL